MGRRAVDPVKAAEERRRILEGNRFESFAWRAFQTRRKTTGAVNEKGDKAYGVKARQLLEAQAKAGKAKPEDATTKEKGTDSAASPKRERRPRAPEMLRHLTTHTDVSPEYQQAVKETVGQIHPNILKKISSTRLHVVNPNSPESIEQLKHATDFNLAPHVGWFPASGGDLQAGYLEHKNKVILLDRGNKHEIMNNLSHEIGHALDANLDRYSRGSARFAGKNYSETNQEFMDAYKKDAAALRGKYLGLFARRNSYFLEQSERRNLTEVFAEGMSVLLRQQGKASESTWGSQVSSWVGGWNAEFERDFPNVMKHMREKVLPRAMRPGYGS